MRKRSGRNLDRLLTQKEVVFIFVITFLISFVVIGFFYDNFSSDFNLSPSRGRGLAEISNEQSSVSESKNILGGQNSISGEELLYDANSLLILFPEEEKLLGFEKDSQNIYLSREKSLARYDSGDELLNAFFKKVSDSTARKEFPARIRKVLPKYYDENPLNNLFVLEGSDVAEFHKLFRRAGYHVEYNYVVTTNLIPNDSYFAQYLWALENTGQLETVGADISAPEAWDVSIGDSSVIIAILDSGVYYTHPDLRNNMWMNTGEIQGNSIDDDNNGYIDDVYGYDFVNNDGDPMDDMGHGTHVAGTAAAEQNNNLGVTGVCPECSIMALKFLDETGSGYFDDAVEALYYAVDNGAQITSNSWGCDFCGSNSYVNDAFDWVDSQGVVSITSAGNRADGTPSHPPANAPSVLSIAATNYVDQKASFSNWGPSTALAAPGETILSTSFVDAPLNFHQSCIEWPQLEAGLYVHCPGTSMAAPHVSGVAGLVLSLNPGLTPAETKSILKSSVDIIQVPYDIGSGRLNAHLAVNNVPPIGSNFPIAEITSLSSSAGFNLDVFGSATVSGSDFVEYTLEVGEGLYPMSWNQISQTNFPVENAYLGSLDSSTLYEGDYAMRLRSRTSISEAFDVDYFTVDNFNIQDPLEHDIYRLGSLISLRGRINSPDFVNYIVEWSLEGSSSWSTDGIILLNNGQVPIFDDEFATWDTSGLSPVEGKYVVRVTLFDQSSSFEENVLIYLDPNLKEGWPVRMYSDDVPLDNFYFGSKHSSVDPLILENNDGTSTIYAYDYVANDFWPLGDTEVEPGELYAFDSDGQLLPNFPVAIETGRTSCILHPGAPLSAIDVDDDGEEEIVFPIVAFKKKPYSSCPDDPGAPYSDLYVRNEVHAYEKDGTLVSGFPHSYYGPVDTVGTGIGLVDIYSSSGTSIVGADVDNDGSHELIAKFQQSLYFLETDGTLLANRIDLGFSMGTCHDYLDREPNIEGAPAVGNFDSDDDLEIVVSYSNDLTFNWPWNGACDFNPLNGNDGIVHVFNHDGTEVAGWPVETPYPGIMSSPAVADLDGDGMEDIVLGVNTRVLEIQGPLDGSVYAFNRYGQILPGWPIPNFGSARLSPAIGDLDGDGDLEVVVGEVYSTSETLQAFHHDGTEVAGWPIYHQGYLGSLIYDLDSSPGREVLDSELHFFFHLPEYYLQRNVLGFDSLATNFGLQKVTEIKTHTSPQVKDLDNDGTLEVVASSAEYWSKERASIYVWEIDDTFESGGENIWPTFHHDNQRTGRFTELDYARINPVGLNIQANCAPGDTNNGDGTCTGIYPMIPFPASGTIFSSSSEGDIWSNARDALLGDVLYSQLFYTGSTYGTYNPPFYYQIQRSFNGFDTTPIPDTATVVSAKLVLNVQYVSGDNFDIFVYESLQSDDLLLSLEDFPRCPMLNPQMSDLLASKDINSFVAGELNEFYLSDTSVIDTTGITSLCTRSSYDVFDIPSPEFNSYLRYRLDGNYLEVTYWS